MHIRLALIGISSATLFAIACSAQAQENGDTNQQPDSPASAATPGEPILSEEEEIDHGEVEVSLGDWGIKTRLSEELGVPIADVPLTVALKPDLASEVCPVRESDLEQQVVVSAIRTCAAKSYNADLLEAVRADLKANPPEDSTPGS